MAESLEATFPAPEDEAGVEPVRPGPAGDGLPEDDRVALQSEQLRLTYDQIATVIAGTSVCSVVLVVALWGVVPSSHLVGWLAVNLALNGVRGALAVRFRRTRPPPEANSRWLVIYMAGVFASGAVWGATAVVIYPADELAYQILIAFVVGGLCAGATSTNAALYGMAAAFILPAMLPVATRLMMDGGRVEMFMGGLLLFFLAMLTLIARNMHRAVLESLRLRVENVGLVGFLTASKARAEGLNEELKSEIAERVQAEDALRESEAKFRAVVENAVDGIMLIVDARFIYTNQAAQELLGYSAEEMVGMHITGTMADTPLGRDLIHNRYKSRIAGQVVANQYEAQLKHRDGTIVDVITSSALVNLGGEAGMLAMVKDIREWKRVERMKNEFISVVSHELRTPLTSIHGSLGLIGSGAVGDLSDEVKSLVEVAEQNSERLVRLTNDILDMEKIGSGQMTFANQPRDLVALAREAVEANTPLAASLGVRLRLDVQVEAAPIVADGGRLLQVFANLLSNAAKFSPQGEVVDVRVTTQEGAHRVAIVNRGPAIPPEFQPHVFEKFAQADATDARRTHGTGLGLSIAKSIVEKQGGRIGFESVQGGETTFYFDLPVAG